MAVTKEQLEQAIKVLNTQANDPSLDDATRAQKKAELTKLSVAYKGMGDTTATAPLTSAADSSTDQYLGDKVKTGLTAWLSNILPDPISAYMFDLEPASAQIEAAKGGKLFDMQAGREIAAKRELAKQQAIQDKAKEWFGVAPRAPSNTFEKYMGIGLESVASDPLLSMVGGPSKALNLISSGASAAGGAFSYEEVSQIAKALGATPEWQDKWGKVAAFAGGTASGFGTGMLQSGFDTVVQAKKTLDKNRSIQDSLDKASDYIVSNNAKKVIDDIVAVEPDIDKHIEAIKSLGTMVPGFSVAPGIALHDNAIIRKNMEVLLKESPQFRASVEANLKDLGNAVKTRQATLFGTANDADVYKQIARVAPNYGVKLDNVQKRINALDSQIDSVLNTARTTQDALMVGTAASRLIDAKEAALRAKNSVEYERILNKYTEQGVEFPAESVQALHDFVGGVTAEKLFTPFPTLVNKINQYLKPTQAPGSPSASLSDFLTRTGARLSGDIVAPKQYKPLTLRQLDSLKQEVNASIRKASGTTAGPALVEFKKLLDSKIREVPAFGDEYKAVDASFYRDLGIPFDSAGLSQLDSLKFNETVGSYLSKPERAADFISFVGDAGVPVVKDAILLKMRNKVFTPDGTFKPAQYSKFLNENKAVINTVPGFRQELADVSATVAKMDATKARLDSQFNQAAEKQAANFVLAIKNEGLDKAIDGMLSSPKKLQEYSSSIKNLDADSAYTVRQGIRSALINKAFKNTGGAQEFIKANPEAFKTWFGDTYAKNVDALTQANDILKTIDPSRMGFAFSYKEADALQSLIGTSVPQAGSILRDRISAPVHKASIILSRWFTKRTAGKRDEAMAELLLNPNALDRIAKTSAAYKEQSINVEEYAKRIANIMNFALYKGTTMAEQGATTAQQQSQ